jgi:DNA-binding MarR family transcriptional regulator
VQQVQVAFPQIYLACHTRHQRKRSTAHRLSSRDASILAHLDVSAPITPAKLAAHLGVARSTLSEALKRLEALGYVGGGDARRRTSVVLTTAGATAIADTSVLETPLLQRALAKASAQELRAIARGLTLLAQKCRTGKD